MRDSLSSQSTSNALREFLDRSPCPYAQRASVARCGPWPDPRPLGERIDDLRTALLDLTEQGDKDLLVLEIERADRLENPRDAAALVHALLQGLRARDDSCDDPLTRGIESPAWDFRHGDENFFVSLFAPLYPRSHSRFSGHDSVGFVLFQPERSFRRFGVSSRHPRRARLAQGVHRRFKKHGQDYDLQGNSATPKAMRFVKPIGSGEPIAWWRVPYEAEVG